MNSKEFIQQRFSEEKSYKFLRYKGAVLNGVTSCKECGGRVVREQGKFRHSYNGKFSCINRYCRASFSLLLQSVFEGCRFPFSKLCLLIWCYVKKLRLEEASSVIGISKKTTVKWFKIFRMKEQENEKNTDPPDF